MSFSPRLALLVFLGGALGTLARFELDVLLDFGPLLFVVNILGSFVLGAVSADSKGNNESRAFFGIGFAGGFTTMSGVSLLLLVAGDVLPMMSVYMFVMFGLALLAYYTGLRMMSRGEK